ncbi:hypothetical protein M9H77_36693 [Catharanthus roseus]|uniref:Uncharacterized protein n=1 Tax=Catharanthus roseus TaxID=4058 RepID=A0ACB9ZSX0_CATRO|nr:hypothetical protein M9H77_36693 [Catharanthus roseus]
MVHFMDSKSSSDQDVLVIRANHDDPMKAAIILTTYKVKYSFSRDNDDSFHEEFSTKNNDNTPHESLSISIDFRSTHSPEMTTMRLMKDLPP